MLTFTTTATPRAIAALMADTPRGEFSVDDAECATVTLVRCRDERSAGRLIRRVAASGCRVWAGRARTFDPTARRAMDHLR